MHLYLQQNQWPANEFVDLFMSANTNTHPSVIPLGFKLYMIDQYNWVYEKDIEALERLLEQIKGPSFRKVDRKNLFVWTENILHSARDGKAQSENTLPKREAIYFTEGLNNDLQFESGSNPTINSLASLRANETKILKSEIYPRSKTLLITGALIILSLLIYSVLTKLSDENLAANGAEIANKAESDSSQKDSSIKSTDKQSMANNSKKITSVEIGGEITEGYPSGKKIHMVGDGNSRKPYVGFILNIKQRTEDGLVLNGDFNAALIHYQYLESQGDLSASHNLGLMYLRGLAVKKDIQLAMHYLEQSMSSSANYATSKNYYDKATKESSGIRP